MSLGYVKDKSTPPIKKVINGKTIKIPIDKISTGICLPNSSLCFLAYLATKIIEIIAATNEEKNNEKFVQTNLGTYQPLTVKKLMS